eukprot:scaffold387_cov244-Pinguiococcus_pyrenoidosus.AAC.4
MSEYLAAHCKKGLNDAPTRQEYLQTYKTVDVASSSSLRGREGQACRAGMDTTESDTAFPLTLSGGNPREHRHGFTSDGPERVVVGLLLKLLSAPVGTLRIMVFQHKSTVRAQNRGTSAIGTAADHDGAEILLRIRRLIVSLAEAVHRLRCSNVDPVHGIGGLIQLGDTDSRALHGGNGRRCQGCPLGATRERENVWYVEIHRSRSCHDRPHVGSAGVVRADVVQLGGNASRRPALDIIRQALQLLGTIGVVVGTLQAVLKESPERLVLPPRAPALTVCRCLHLRGGVDSCVRLWVA